LIKLLYILAAFALLSSCNFTEEDKKVVAQVYDYKLYEDELISVVPSEISYEDSILFINDYINQWTHNHAILQKAKTNDLKIESDDIELEKQVEEYRNTMLIYRYTKRLIEQRLDTIVKYEEVEEYYNAHKEEFTLKDDIVQVAFIKLSLESKNIKQIRKLLKDYKEEDNIKIRKIAEDKAANYFLDENTWILFDDLLKEIPIQTYNKTLYLKNNKFIEVKDSLFTYMLRINNYRIQDNLSPLSFEYDRIRTLIINMRKIELIERMKKDVFVEAQEQGAIHIEIKLP
jgi:hypothetical protein